MVADESRAYSHSLVYLESLLRQSAPTDSGIYERPDERFDPNDPRVGYWEGPFFEALKKAGLNPVPQYPVDQYRLDFAIVYGDTHLDVEVDGELYHKEWDGARCKSDIIRDIRLTALGWKVKRFWVYRVRDEMDQCVQEVIHELQEASKPDGGATPGTITQYAIIIHMARLLGTRPPEDGGRDFGVPGAGHAG